MLRMPTLRIELFGHERCRLDDGDLAARAFGERHVGGIDRMVEAPMRALGLDRAGRGPR